MRRHRKSEGAPGVGVGIALLAAWGAACGGGDPPEPQAGGAGGPAARGSTAGAVRLLARREVAVPGRPVGLLARDYDGDGVGDVVCVTRRPGALVLLRGTAEGLAPDGPGRALGGDHPLAPVDLGALGFAVALQGRAELLWFADAGAEPVRVALDAKPRALGAHVAGGRGEVLVAGADGTLAVVALAAGAAAVERVHALPVELHGRPTLVRRAGELVVVGDQLGEALHLFAPGADGALAARGRIELGGIPRDAVELDLDGDGDLELAVAGGDRSVWALGLGAGGGHAAWTAGGAAPVDLGAPGAIPVDLERVDLDGDGRDELVCIDLYDSGYGVLGGFGADGAPRLVRKEYAGQDPVDAALADLDGDGNVDLAVANRGAGRVSLLLGTGFAEPGRAAFYQSFRVPCAQNPTRVATANLDADPLPEAVVVCAGDRLVQGRRNRLGLLAADGPVLARGTGARRLAAGTDGADVWLLEAGAGGARLVGVGADGAERLAADAGAEATDLAALAGPEGTTLVAVDAAGRALHALDPGAAETRRAGWPGADAPLAACAIDVDGDGADELAVASRGELRLLDRGLAPLGGPLAIAIPGHAPEALAAADVDGDGASDLVVLYGGAADTAPGRVAVLLAEAAGGFRRAALEETGLAPAAIAAGDVNGDGRAEVFCAAQNSHNVNAWTPDAEGPRLLRRLPDLGAGLGPLDVHLVDLDGDGRLDLVTANNFSHDLSVAYNLSR